MKKIEKKLSNIAKLNNFNNCSIFSFANNKTIYFKFETEGFHKQWERDSVNLLADEINCMVKKYELTSETKVENGNIQQYHYHHIIFEKIGA